LAALGALAAVVVAVVMGPATALAHAEYESSTPGRDEVVAESPERVDVYFTQEVFKQEGANFVRVHQASGAVGADFCAGAGEATQVSDAEGVVDDDDRTHISAELPRSLDAGRYVVCWMTTSDEDGDVDSGAFCFYVAVEPMGEQAAECAALAGDEAPTPTAGLKTPATQAVTPASTATPVGAGGDGDGDGGNTTVAVIAAIAAGVAVLVGLGAGALAWQRRRGG
jgi:methionine-rich copper-binding protein CopC